MAIDAGLPPRYEIRTLEPKHRDWVTAIVIHSNVFYSGLWPTIYPEGKAKRAMSAIGKLDYLIEHQINSGYSIGIFDKEYKFKRPESEATDGKLYWDSSLEDDEDGSKLLEAMDFPLVSVAMSYDGINALDGDKLKPTISVLPAFENLYAVLAARDPRDPASWKAQAPGEVLMRNATSTRREYEGQGLMAKMARYLMRRSAEQGFRGIQIECVADRVTQVWSNPPAPFEGEVISEFECKTWAKEEGVEQKDDPFFPADQRITKVYVTLK